MEFAAHTKRMGLSIGLHVEQTRKLTNWPKVFVAPSTRSTGSTSTRNLCPGVETPDFFTKDRRAEGVAHKVFQTEEKGTGRHLENGRPVEGDSGR